MLCPIRKKYMDLEIELFESRGKFFLEINLSN